MAALSWQLDVEDDTYQQLQRILEDVNDRSLTPNEFQFMSQVEALEYMSGFRPDWYPDEHKKKMIQLMKDRYL